MVYDVTRGKLLLYVLDRNAHFYHKHHGVIRQIGKLVDRFLFITRLARNYNLGAFLSDLFENFVYSLFKQIGGVGIFRHLLFAAFEQTVKTVQLELVKLVAPENLVGKTTVSSEMAGRTVLFHHNGQSVIVAVGGYAHDVLVIAARFALEPQLTARTAVKAGQLFLHRDFERFTVHISHGQHILGKCVDHDGGYKSLFVKFEFVNIYHNYDLCFI